MAAFLAAFLTVLCFKFVFMTVFAKCVLAFIYFKDHITAASAVAAVRTAIGYIKLPAKAYMSVSAFS